MTLLTAMRMTQVLEDIVGLDAKDRSHSHREQGVETDAPYGSQRQSFSPAIDRVLEVLLDVSSKLVGLMGSADEEEEDDDDGGGLFLVVIFGVMELVVMMKMMMSRKMMRMVMMMVVLIGIWY